MLSESWQPDLSDAPFQVVSAENLGYGVDPSGPSQCGHLHNGRSLLGAHAMGHIRVASDPIALPEKAERRPIAIPEGAWPRLMKAPRAAAYLDISPSHFLAEVKARRLPQPKHIGGCSLWDRRQLDLVADQLPGGEDCADDRWSVA